MLSRHVSNRSSAIWELLVEFADATATSAQIVANDALSSAAAARSGHAVGEALKVHIDARNAVHAAAWLRARFGLGHAEASALAHFVSYMDTPENSSDQSLDRIFRGLRKPWRQPTMGLCRRTEGFGQDVEARPNGSYINLRRGLKRFGLIQVYARRVKVGLILKGVSPKGRLQLAGSWNTMVTHVFTATDADSLDGEIMLWLANAYAAAK